MSRTWSGGHRDGAQEQSGDDRGQDEARGDQRPAERPVGAACKPGARPAGRRRRRSGAGPWRRAGDAAGCGSRPRCWRYSSRRAPRRSRPAASRWPSRPGARRGPSPSWARGRSPRRPAAGLRSWTGTWDGLSLSTLGVGSGPGCRASRIPAGIGPARRSPRASPRACSPSFSTSIFLAFLTTESTSPSISFSRPAAPSRMRSGRSPGPGRLPESQGMKVNPRTTRTIVRSGSATRRAGFLSFLASSPSRNGTTTQVHRAGGEPARG